MALARPADRAETTNSYASVSCDNVELTRPADTVETTNSYASASCNEVEFTPRVQFTEVTVSSIGFMIFSEAQCFSKGLQDASATSGGVGNTL